jgi:hypothetical protein
MDAPSIIEYEAFVKDIFDPYTTYVVEKAQYRPVNVADDMDAIFVAFPPMVPKTVVPGLDPLRSFATTDDPLLFFDVNGSPPISEFPATLTPSFATYVTVTRRPTFVYVALLVVGLIVQFV